MSLLFCPRESVLDSHHFNARPASVVRGSAFYTIARKRSKPVLCRSTSISHESSNIKLRRSREQTDKQLEGETGVRGQKYAACRNKRGAPKQNVMFHYGNGALWRALLNNNFQMSG